MRTVHSLLATKGAAGENLLKDPLVELATRTIVVRPHFLHNRIFPTQNILIAHRLPPPLSPLSLSPFSGR